MNASAGLFDHIAELPLLRASLIDRAAGETLAALCASIHARTIVEVGTFLGMGSTQVFCQALPADGRLFCVDTFNVSMARYQRPHDPHYHAFLSNIKQTGVGSKIIPLRMSSLEASRALDIAADLVFIDGDHSMRGVLADIAAWMPHVRPGGILCGDDYAVDICPDVTPAVQRALPGHRAEGRIWWIQKPQP